MKRTRKSQDTKAGIIISLSDVYEVEFVRATQYHKVGDKKEVSLPLAAKFYTDGKVKMSKNDEATIKEFIGKIA